ncbi:hypothetical protein [Streptomyces triticirhizae]|uniref:hypothetical protein n=1 Tax=Streptomyces triticirhizae TaxID=2483353 RepID=UPI00267E8969|nr:hypothetical protein [Streptomyces triticirhizae]
MRQVTQQDVKGEVGAGPPPAPAEAEPPDAGWRGELVAAAVAAVLFAASAVIGTALNDGDRLRLQSPPLLASWSPHLGPGTVPALLAAGIGVLYGPTLARRLPWRALLVASWAAATGWLLVLAWIDGWHRGVVNNLETKHEYLRSVDEINAMPGWGHFLDGFVARIPIDAVDNWPAHVAGHPPGATLTFALLDRIGLHGGIWASMFCVLWAASVPAAVLVTVRVLAGERLARRAAPFLVWAPAAVWLGVSADAYFAAVGAWAVALLALAARGRSRAPGWRWRGAALGSGLLFGLLCYLSYGLTLMALVGVAVLLLTREWRPVPYVLWGVAVWVVAFTAGGFWWYEGYQVLVERYFAGAGGQRPYGYFVWANVAAQVLTVGLATAAALWQWGPRLVGSLRGLAPGRRAPEGYRALVVLVASAVCALLVADLSGMSKAETERIWLPFVVWLLPVTALLPRRRARWWLAAQVVMALLVNHLYRTTW